MVKRYQSCRPGSMFEVSADSPGDHFAAMEEYDALEMLRKATTGALELRAIEVDTLKARVAALAAELAGAKERWGHWQKRSENMLAEGIKRYAEQSALQIKHSASEARVAALEAFLVKVLPAGIEDVCDECGGDLAKCKAENPDCYIAEARRLLPASVPETKTGRELPDPPSANAETISGNASGSVLETPADAISRYAPNTATRTVWDAFDIHTDERIGQVFAESHKDAIMMVLRMGAVEGSFYAKPSPQSATKSDRQWTCKCLVVNTADTCEECGRERPSEMKGDAWLCVCRLTVKKGYQCLCGGREDNSEASRFASDRPGGK